MQVVGDNSLFQNMWFLENRCGNKKIYNQLTKAIIAKISVYLCFMKWWSKVSILYQKTASDPVDFKGIGMTIAFPTIFSNIWSRHTVGQGCPHVNNSETNYDDADINSPRYNCNVLVTEWDQWQDITYLWRQLMWSVGWLWFPGDHYLPHDQWPMAPSSSF